MKRIMRVLLPALALCLVASAKKESAVTVGFYPEAIGGDPKAWPDPVYLTDPDRRIFRSKIAAISERDIASIYLYENTDQSVGCVFMLNDHGREALDKLSVERRGSTLTAVVNNRMIINMLIDRRITDGILVIPHGMTIPEGLALEKSFKVLKTPPGASPAPAPAGPQ